MNWIDIKEEETIMWMKIFGRFKIYILKKNNKERTKKRWKKKK